MHMLDGLASKRNANWLRSTTLQLHQKKQIIFALF